jgi:hypothetical protein
VAADVLVAGYRGGDVGIGGSDPPFKSGHSVFQVIDITPEDAAVITSGRLRMRRAAPKVKMLVFSVL